MKSKVIAYILFFLVGDMGLHQFYIGNRRRGMYYDLALVFQLIGLVCAFINLSSGDLATLIVAIVCLTAWLLPFSVLWIYDLFTLPAQIRKINDLVGGTGKPRAR